MKRDNGGRLEVIGWKVRPKAWFPEIGLFDAASIREAKQRAAEKAAEKAKVMQ
jgi:hypothetical protein